MVKCLEQEGVSVLFGYPGATIAPFYDSLTESGIRHVLTRTEQGAGHAASGYARMTGRPGVCVATSGPGATNLLTAIATAYSDSIPLVAITGQVATYQLGRDVFQEVDTTGAAEPFTKHSYLVKSAAELCTVFKEAFHIAGTGRKGPVLIDVPVDVQKQMVQFQYPDKVSIRGYKPVYQGHPLQVAKLAEAIGKAQRPLVCMGGGVFSSGAQDTMRRFCEATGIPAVSTMMGIGALPPSHPLYFGMCGQCGTRSANVAVSDSDLLLFIGARVGDRAINHPDHLESKGAVVHIDIDSAEIGKNMGTTIPIVGDCGSIMQQLIDKQVRSACGQWVQRLGELREAPGGNGREKRRAPGTVDPGAVVGLLCGHAPTDSVYVADVGQNQIWSARNYRLEGKFMTTGGMGTMGYSIPAAIGAKLAAPDRTVLAVCGDGSFQMSMNELATMCQHGAPIKTVIMRNGTLGMVREIQEQGYGGREIGVDLTGSPNFGLIAGAYGIRHRLVENMEQAEEAIAEMMATEGPYLLECVVDPMEGTI